MVNKNCPYRERCNQSHGCYETVRNPVYWCKWAQRLAQEDIEADLEALAVAQELGIKEVRGLVRKQE